MDFDSDFDYDRIPDYILHDAVHETLGDRNLSGGEHGSPYNFRCPICGDSKDNPHKKRGFVMYKRGWGYQCHNECGSMSFIHFLKEYHREVYRRVIFHAFDNSAKRESKYRKKQEELSQAEKSFKGKEVYQFKKGELIGILEDHPTCKIARDYCIKRKIPQKVYHRWFVCLRDKKFLDLDANGHYIYNDRGYPTGNEYGNRLIIPYYTYGGNWVQFDARDLALKSNLRYRNLEGAERELYNVDFINVNQPFFLFEGSIDSTFVRNSVAFGGTKHLLSFLKEYPHIAEHAHNGTVIWDNDEPGYDEMPTTVKLGFNWFDWRTIKPLPEFEYYIDENGERKQRVIKDMNDAVMFTDAFRTDSDGFVVLDDLKKYIRKADGAMILLTMIYGNREKMRREKNRKRNEQMKSNTKKKEIRPYF